MTAIFPEATTVGQLALAVERLKEEGNNQQVAIIWYKRNLKMYPKG